MSEPLYKENTDAQETVTEAETPGKQYLCFSQWFHAVLDAMFIIFD